MGNYLQGETLFFGLGMEGGGRRGVGGWADERPGQGNYTGQERWGGDEVIRKKKENAIVCRWQSVRRAMDKNSRET